MTLTGLNEFIKSKISKICANLQKENKENKKGRDKKDKISMKNKKHIKLTFKRFVIGLKKSKFIHRAAATSKPSISSITSEPSPADYEGGDLSLCTYIPIDI